MRIASATNFLVLTFSILYSTMGFAQNAPSIIEYEGFDAFFKDVYNGNIEGVKKHIKQGVDLEQQDNRRRTALHIAAYQSHDEIFRLLADAGSDLNAFEYMRYDVITIAAVANDIGILKLALKLGGNPANITSPYDGTALIAAAHLGHAEVVKLLLEAGAPVNHVNNLNWTALMEAVVLGDGSAKYVETIDNLLAHDADPGIADRDGVTSLEHARQSGYHKIVQLLSQ